MSLQGISAAFGPLDMQPKGKGRQEVPDASFAELLNTDFKAAQAGVALTPSTEPTAAATAPTVSEAAAVEKTPLELFLEYMNKTPEERWREQWLKQHNMTEEEFAALPPEKQAALEDQMRQDMQEQIHQTVEQKAVDKSMV